MASTASRFRILGFRSSTWAFPPNSEPALQAALDEGADGLVVDVDSTRDGVLVACEDRLLRAVSGSFRGTREATYEQLRKLDVGAGFSPLHHRAPIPRIADIVARFAGQCELMFYAPESAGPDLATKLGETLEGVGEGVAVVSESAEVLEIVHDLNARVRGILRVFDPHAEDVLPLPASIQGVATSVRMVTPEFAIEVAAAGVELIALDCDTLTAATRAQSLPVDAVLTERPGWLLDCLRQQRQVPSRYPRPYAWRL